MRFFLGPFNTATPVLVYPAYVCALLIYLLIAHHNSWYYILPKYYSQAMGLIFAAICHDADHRGFTNSYMQLSNDPLYQLYGEATMEHHHVFIAMIIIDVSFNLIWLYAQQT